MCASWLAWRGNAALMEEAPAYAIIRPREKWMLSYTASYRKEQLMAVQHNARDEYVSFAEYLEIVARDPEHAYEYMDGEVYMMTGGLQIIRLSVQT
jgi:hypothetical protein